MSEDIQTIHCIVNPGTNNILHWLSLRKFELKSRYSNGKYTPLYIDNDNIKSVDAALFLDKAHEEIMGNEKMQFLV
jgi:disulfide oxidoreductase YuzD